MNILAVALAKRAVNLLGLLMDELQVEGCIPASDVEGLASDDEFKITSQYSAWQRAKKLMKELPLLNLLFSQFICLYKMVRQLLCEVIRSVGWLV